MNDWDDSVQLEYRYINSILQDKFGDLYDR